MAASCIRRNQVIDWNGIAYRLAERYPDGGWRLHGMADGAIKLISHDEMLDQYRCGKIGFRIADTCATQLEKTLRIATEGPLKPVGRARKVADVAASGDQTRQQRILEARRRAELCKIADQYPLGSELQAAALRDNWTRIFQQPPPEKLPSISTLWRWSKRLKDAGFDSRALVRRDHLKGRRKEQACEEVAGIIREATADIYLTLHRRPMRDVEVDVVERIRAENAIRSADEQLAFPSFERIREYISGLPEFDKHAARHGLQAARRKFRAVLHNVFAERALQRVELDATRLNFIAVDDAGLPLGRPWLHICIDVRTRCILGYYISYEPPSLASLFECLKHALLPKDHGLLKSWDINNSYPCHGVWERLVLDNAFENHSEALNPLADAWGGDIQWCPRRSPWYKARIERFIRTLGDQVCQILPGTTFSGILQRGDYDPVSNAMISWRDIEKIVATWIVDVYHQKIHSTIQCSPINAWRSCVCDEDLLMPCSADELRQLCRVPEVRRLTHKGIEMYGLYWNSDELTAMRYALGSELDVRVFVNRMNLGSIGVENPRTREIMEVNALAFDYAQNLTLHQHRVTRAYARRFSSGRADSISTWIDGQRRILEIIDAARSVAGYCLPAPAARFLLGNGQRELPPASAAPVDSEPALQVPDQEAPARDSTDDWALDVEFAQTARHRGGRR